MAKSARAATWLLALAASAAACPASVLAADAQGAPEASRSWKIKPSLTISGGYATNPDENEEPEPSFLAEYSAALEVTHEIENVESSLKIEASSVDYFDLEENSRRAYEVSGSTKITLDGGSVIKIEGARLDDGLSGSRIVEHEASAKWEKTGKNAGVSLKALFDSKDFVDEADNDRDFYKPNAEVRIDLNPEGKISPFVKAQAGLVRYPRQEDANVNRDGKDYSLIAGAVFKPTDKLEIELGGRYNLRTLDEADIAKHSNAFVEANLAWSPTDALEIETAVVRSLKEPSASDAVVRDSTKYTAGVTWKTSEKLTFELSGGYEKKDEIGAETVKHETGLEGGASYAASKHLTIFGKVSQTWNRDLDTSTGEVSKSANTEFKVGMTTSFDG